MKRLLIGGARSGKSRLAEEACLSLPAKDFYYIATGWAGDDEMAERIAHHRAIRDARWQLREIECELGGALGQLDSAENVILIDCLTLWLSNCLHRHNWPSQRVLFLESLERTRASVFMVTNEVGSGVVPIGELSRVFVDEAGRLHQQVAARCDRVDLIVAGMALTLKEYGK